LPLQPLIKHLESFLPLSQQEKKMVEQHAIRQKVKRRQFILKESAVCRHYSFVVNGCFRMFGTDDKGYEHNIQFAAENDWVADIGSFHSGKQSKLFIQAIEPAEIIQIEQEDLYFLYLNIVKLDRIFKVIIENKFTELQNRVLQNFSSTAQQRYISFLEQYPLLANRLPGIHIASYIGITPEFLSKIRKELSIKA
jgi:CRP-like cAMP-binding protein